MLGLSAVWFGAGHARTRTRSCRFGVALVSRLGRVRDVFGACGLWWCWLWHWGHVGVAFGMHLGRVWGARVVMVLVVGVVETDVVGV